MLFKFGKVNNTKFSYKYKFAAFADCEKIQEIRIPSSVTAISYNVFSGSAIGGKMYVPFTKEEGKPSGGMINGIEVELQLFMQMKQPK